MTIKSVNAPAINVEDIQKLKNFCSPERMHSQSTLFDAGYEQAKRDFLAKLETLVGRPTSLDPGGEVQAPSVPPEELRMRNASVKTQKRWWHL